MEVMELWGGQEGQVVAAVGDGGADESHAVPHAGGGQVRAQDDRPDHHGQRVGDLRGETSAFRHNPNLGPSGIHRLGESLTTCSRG